jgi:lipoate-protein ligase A
MPSVLSWRLVLDEARPGPANMALDHALAARLRESEGVVRLYGWSRPTVSFGKNEPAERIGTDRAGENAWDYVRRPTGGRAVLHDQELTYAVVAPLDAFGGLREAYVRINEALAAALRSLGAAVQVVGSGVPALGPDAGPCFQAPAAGEIVANGRKVVGSAQARLEGALLQHGSILLGGDQGPLGGDASGSAPITLSELLGEVDRDALTRATADSMRAAFGGRWTTGALRDDELETASRLEAERYGRDTWTWRRRQEGA